jgi:hypothetical protein
MKRIFIPLLLVLMAACSSTKPITVINKENLYTNDQEWKVAIKDGWFSAKTISIGDYSTTARKNGITPASPSAQFKSTKNASNFNVKGEDENMLVQILNTPLITFSDKKLPTYISERKSENPLFYAWINGTRRLSLQSWEMVLRDPTYLELNDNANVGIFRSGTEVMRISATNKFGIANSYERPCYEFHANGRPLAAVMIAEQPRVWVNAKIDPEQKKILVAAIAALLMRN